MPISQEKFQKVLSSCLLVFLLLFAPAPCQSNVAAASRPIRIGVLLDLTGPLCKHGEAAYKSIQYAVEEINVLGGVSGRRMEVTIFDTKADRNRMLEGAAQFKAQAVAALIGPSSPANCILLRRYAEQEKIPLILISGTSPILSFSGIKTKWTFSTTLNFSSELKALFEVFKKRSYQSLGVLVQTGRFYKELFLWIRGYAPEYGLRLDCAEGFNLNPEDLSQKIAFLNRCGPDAGLIWANGDTQGLVSTVLQRADLPLGLSHHIFGQISTQASNSTNKLLFVALPSALAPAGFQRRLSFSARDFLDRWGEELEAMSFDSKLYAAQAWDALKVLAKALKFSRSGSRDSLRKALETNIKDYYGVVGKFSYDKRDHSYLDPSSLSVIRFFAGRWGFAR